MMKNKNIAFNTKDYIWDGTRWYEDRTRIIPPLSIIVKLNILLEPELEQEDRSIENIDELMRRARNAKEMYQYNRARTLSLRVLELSKGHIEALTILCYSLRAQGKPEEAIKQTDDFKDINYAPLLISRAGAFCDLNKWEEAKAEITKSMSIENNNETTSIINRIKSERPDLYEEKKEKPKKSHKKSHPGKSTAKESKDIKKEKIKASNKKALEKLKKKFKMLEDVDYIDDSESDIFLCPCCNSPVEEDGVICPYCNEDMTSDTKIEVTEEKYSHFTKKPCLFCQEPIYSTATICSYCKQWQRI